jgi:hypothetical protein
LNLQPSALETDALPLSYSPKELDDLAALLCGYSSAVAKEADVYPFSRNVARVFRKNRSMRVMAVFVITIAGCWHSPSTPPPPLTNTELPRAVSPVLPDVTAAEVGIWDGDGVFHATHDIPLYPGSTFGWRINLPCKTGLVSVAEELHLPAPGDWPSDPEMDISADRTSVVLHYDAECRSGWIEKQWSVSPGDPPGAWSIRVTPDGFAAKTFRVTFAATP